MPDGGGDERGDERSSLDERGNGVAVGDEEGKGVRVAEPTDAGVRVDAGAAAEVVKLGPLLGAKGPTCSGGAIGSEPASSAA